MLLADVLRRITLDFIPGGSSIILGRLKAFIDNSKPGEPACTYVVTYINTGYHFNNSDGNKPSSQTHIKMHPIEQIENR